MHAAAQQLGWYPTVHYGNTASQSVAVVSQYVDGPGKNYVLVGGSGWPDATTPNPSNKLITAFRKDINAAGLGNDPVNFSAVSFAGWAAVQSLQYLTQRVKGAVTKAALVAAAHTATVKKPISFYGVFSWAPGSPGPASVPCCRNGTIYAHIWKDNHWNLTGTYNYWTTLGYKLP
jgi:hypothetical protein